MGVNLLPVITDSRWRVSSETTNLILGIYDVSCTFSAPHKVVEITAAKINSNLSFWAGKSFTIGFDTISNTNVVFRAAYSLASFEASIDYSTINKISFVIPADVTDLTQLTFVFKAMSEYVPGTASFITGIYLEETVDVEEPPPIVPDITIETIKFAKVNKTNLPASVASGEEYVFFTDTREIYVTNKTGIPVLMLSGTQGNAGKSIYDIWLDSGNIGTEQDFINTLKSEAAYNTYSEIQW